MTSDFRKSLDALDLPPEVRARLANLAPPPFPHREIILNRLSLPRTFTLKVYAAATRDLPSPAPFDAFTTLPEVDSLPTYPGRFSITEKVRQQSLRSAQLEPEEWRRWASRCADVLDPADPIEGFDRLQVLLFANPQSAVTSFRAVFEQADTAHDISRCGALVQLLASALAVLDDANIQKLFRELQARYLSRSLFYTEFLQTAQYFSRVGMEGKLTDFLNSKGSGPWVFHIHATGGMGKTTVLRRMISHRWVIGQDRYPCAWIDFDYLDVNTVLLAPWLLALPIAAQWNEQLEEPIFGSLLDRSSQPLASLLFRAPADGAARGLASPTAESLSRTQYQAGRSNPMRCGILAGAIPPDSLEGRNNLLASARDLRSVWDEKLRHAMAKLPAGRPILLVLDTLEEASIQHSQDLRKTLAVIQEWRNKVRALAPIDIRLILSGRHEIGTPQHLPEFGSDFKDQYVSHRLEGFDDPEARVFLEELIPARQQHLIPAMISKSQGVPFNLSLFAEWAKDEPDLKIQTIQDSEEITTVMLIERIVKRIPYQPLRWIIRYGVVPRTLTLEFLQDVMRQPLIDALSGQAAAQGRDHPGSSLEQDVWNKESNFEFDAEKLWRGHVLPYASARGWMVPENREVKFRPDILTPMRTLLRRQRIFGDLHEAARDWFEEQSKNPQQWLAAKTESLYHSLQLRAVPDRPQLEILPRLWDILDSASLAFAPALRRDVAEELLEADFANLRPPERAYLEYRLAEAIAAENNYGYTNPDAVRRLTSAFEIAGAEHSGVLPPFAFEWIRAAHGVPLSAWVENMTEKMTRLPPGDGIQLGMLVAEIGAQHFITPDVLKMALRIWNAAPRPVVPRAAIHERLAQYYSAASPADAIPYLEAAAADYGASGNLLKRNEVLRTNAGLQIDLGRLRRAEEILVPLRASVDREPSVLLQVSRLELAKAQPGIALDYLRALDSSKLTQAQENEALVLRAEALSQRILWQEAQEVWHRGLELAERTRQTAIMARCLLGMAKLSHWWLRRTDRSYISGLMRRAQDLRTSLEPAQADEIDVWQVVSTDDPNALRRRAYGELGGSSPAAKVRLILVSSGVRMPLPEGRWKELLEQAEEIPQSARSMALAAPVLMGDPPLDVPLDLRRQIADVFRYEPEGDAEAAWYGIRYGELLAWLGFYDEAADSLRRYVPLLDFSTDHVEGWRVAVHRERRRIEQRMHDWGARGVDLNPDPPDGWRRAWGHTPFRYAAASIENAQRAFDNGRMDIAKDCLDRAMPLLAEVPFETAFHQMGNRLRDKLAGGTAEKNKPAAEELPEIAPTFTSLTLRPQAGRLAARLGDSEVLVSTDTDTLELILRARGIPRRLVGKQPAELAVDLREILGQAGVNLHIGRRIGLWMPLSPLSAAPWEIAFEESIPPFRISASEVAGAFANTTNIFPASGASLLFPLSPQDKESPAVSAYLDLPRRFPAAGSFEALNQRAPTPILYIASSFVELPSLSEPALAGLEATPTTLALTLRARNGRSRPAVFLDVPAVHTDADYIHQLLLRNYFAQALLESGAVSCVFALGLQNESHTRRVHDFLDSAFKQKGLTQTSLFDSLSALDRDSLPTDALFTSNPEAPVSGEVAYA